MKLRTPTRAQIDLAISQSPLARMPAPAREALVASGRITQLRSREYFIRNGAPERVGLVVTGFARSFGATREGRGSPRAG